MTKVLASFLTTIALASVTLWAEHTLAAQLVKLESISYDEVCGVDSDGNTKCVASGIPTRPPDSMGSITHGFANDLMNCALDAGEAKCWKQYTGSERVDGNSVPDAIRKFLKSAVPESIRLSSSAICGELKTSKELFCIVPDWFDQPTRSLRIKPTGMITAIGVSSALICWGDGTPVESKINCAGFRPTWTPPVGIKFKGLTEILVRSNWMCARSQTEAQCWHSGGVATLPAEFAMAQSWTGNYDGICALTIDLRIVCADPETGKILPASLGTSIPPEYTLPNLDIKQLWANDSSACVLETSGIVKCWNWWNATARQTSFSRPVVELFGASGQPCAKLDNGQAECRLDYLDSRTLKSTDRVRVSFSGWNKCFWNSSGIDCRGRMDDFAVESVKSFVSSTDDETICAIGVMQNAPAFIDTVQCSGYFPELKSPPTPLKNPKTIATNGDQVCALSDEGLTCWGVPFDEVPPPTNVINATRLTMSRRHACVIDQFGLVCWGDLKALDLEVPSGLEQPGRVVDVAVGASRTCAVLDNGQVECWGRDYELSGPPPPMTAATSIIGRGGLFCATDKTGLHCWGGNTSLPK